jgi:phosphoribosyl-ATP pyrophosphohydrolase
MDDLNTIESLKVKAADIRQRNSYWEGCNDGSYEMALHNAGYDKIVAKIKELESELNIVRGYN